MSVKLWAYEPNKCDGDYCPNCCDICSKADVDEEHILDEIENMGVPEPPLEIFLVSPDILAMDSLVCHIAGIFNTIMFRPGA